MTDAAASCRSTSPATLAATVFGLGLGDQVVGRDSSTGFAEAAGPARRHAGRPHARRPRPILALAPTVVITDTTLGPRDVLAQLRDAGIPVVIVDHGAQHRHDRRPRRPGRRRPRRSRARRAAHRARVDAELAAVAAEIDARGPRRRRPSGPACCSSTCAAAPNVYYLFGEESGADSLIEAVGGVDVAGEIGWEGMRPVTAEALVAGRARRRARHDEGPRVGRRRRRAARAHPGAGRDAGRRAPAHRRHEPTPRS